VPVAAAIAAGQGEQSGQQVARHELIVEWYCTQARIGAVLFIRATRSVGLTEAGEFLLRARRALEELVAAAWECADPTTRSIMVAQ
jgi:hypothetical protein